MKELLKKLRWRWHRDITEGSLESLTVKLDRLEELCTKENRLVEAALNHTVAQSPHALQWKFEESGVVVEQDKLRDAVQEYNKIKEAMLAIGPIKSSAMQNVRAFANRVDILEYLPKGKVCAEVGVMYGDFSKKILQIMQPSIFYAIDTFKTPDVWGRTDFADSHLNQLEWYEREFSNEIQVGRLRTVRGYSWDVLETFPDEFFDFIYLDACHNFDSAMRDVEVIRRKIKNGGIIGFNDYVLHNLWIPGTQANGYYGVVPAVNKLINETNSEVLFLGMETMQANDIVIRFRD